MKIQILMCAIIVMCAFIMPMSSQAHQPTEKTVTKINDTFTLFTVSYSFNFAQNSLLMPTQAKLSQGASTNKALIYSLTSGNNPLKAGAKTQAVIVSTSDLKDGYYYSPEGKRTQYTLVVLADTSAMTTADKEKLTLNITSLPFTMVKDSVALTFDLPKETLELYTTPPTLAK